jgi:hypothetical protein
MAQTPRTDADVQMRQHVTDADADEGHLEDEGRGWCGVRTYITGPQAIRAGRIGEFRSNCKIDSDPGCKSPEIDEVSWTITDVPTAYQNWIHIQSQSTEMCLVKVDRDVPSGTQFTLHASAKAHALGIGTNTRVVCQVNKADAQIISVS